ncbi:unnamed protein product [Didymodactylos carnosus]|uniref:Uncharacterized protein n=1 Tax=Didymodactylos carnosus TaxID=1234261 RepID=A0A813TMH7_9BILA|nr:unnamed protein product [Didymodactylos carnosus]CAF0837425.1 unnamed protein product [Didymodactylos carnosus]CAF3599737.1 unnamed protein product [Didymodactylos carnosus]CAF3622295.1 unnamed protein product [Didymodactylos carnosus]
MLEVNCNIVMVHQDYPGVNLMPPQSMHPAYSFVTQQMSPYKHHHHHAQHPSHMPPMYHQQVPTNPYYSHRNQASLLRGGIGLPLPSQVSSQQQQQQQQQQGGGQMDQNHNPLDSKHVL